MTTVAEALDEVRKAIPRVVWIDVTDDSLPETAKGYEGHSIDGWRFVVVIWQEKNWWSTASKAGLVFILPPEITKIAVDAIRKGVIHV